MPKLTWEQVEEIRAARAKSPRNYGVKEFAKRFGVNKGAVELAGQGKTFGRRPQTLLERFLSNVSKAESGCWEWTASKNNQGYGQFTHSRPGGKRQHIANRMSWELHVGSIPSGMYVLHRCDNPACVNPNHLFLGTQRDNMRDMVRKGRHCPSKLNDEQIREIREKLSRRMKQRDIAKEYGVDQRIVTQINRGQKGYAIRGR